MIIYIYNYLAVSQPRLDKTFETNKLESYRISEPLKLQRLVLWVCVVFRQYGSSGV